MRVYELTCSFIHVATRTYFNDRSFHTAWAITGLPDHLATTAAATLKRVLEEVVRLNSNDY